MAAVITVVVGHRGSGKTAFLRRAERALRAAGEEATFVDLDHEIEQAAGRPISELFPAIGEAAFRELERSTAAAVFSRLAGVRAFVATGAGFDGHLPADAEVLWVQRLTDPDGRIFLDRPPLDPGRPPLDEYRDRYRERTERYRARATETYVVPEGVGEEPIAADRLLLGLGGPEVGGLLTVTAADIGHDRWPSFVAKRLRWGIDRFEIRDDLIDGSASERVRHIPPDRLLLARRTAGSWLEEPAPPGALVDWALEVGSPPPGADIVSLHAGGVAEGAARLTEHEGTAHLKLAVEVGDFAELAAGHRWRMDDPEGRSFLPRSRDGRWSWYRLAQRGSMEVNFFREGAGSAADQPTLAEWAAMPPSTSFAAILGDPVHHSRTPEHHREFFARRGMGVVRVPMAEGELTEATLEVLADIGLTHAAVTAPLKQQALELCREVTGPAAALGAVNTLRRSPSGWVGTNTDVDGMEPIATAARGTVALWGGGGTRAMALAALPGAVPYSARTGRPRDGDGFGPDGPDSVVWAVGRSRQGQCTWPPASWRPQRVIDLNYSEDSPGLEYAQQAGAEYTSGLAMFRAQAARQQEFWDGG